MPQSITVTTLVERSVIVCIERGVPLILHIFGGLHMLALNVTKRSSIFTTFFLQRLQVTPLLLFNERSVFVLQLLPCASFSDLRLGPGLQHRCLRFGLSESYFRLSVLTILHRSFLLLFHEPLFKAFDGVHQLTENLRKLFGLLFIFWVRFQLLNKAGRLLLSVFFSSEIFRAVLKPDNFILPCHVAGLFNSGDYTSH